MKSKEEQLYWYYTGYHNGKLDIDDGELTIPTEYAEDYGYGLLDGDMNAHPDRYEDSIYI
ncbi:hypothetical protein RND61_15530 [Streptomyces sp. TRM76323]|uniref:Uncharacterized protein n=1 Tax=Streptomyces tamarix TaxID=3078565 RepID=A0ABU3QL17_9ACTN|nr:hypothetical protein [Streptomyces tamarix]MDT9683459.1 hypothetical protein [Streptomyces tamarix]